MKKTVGIAVVVMVLCWASAAQNAQQDKTTSEPPQWFAEHCRNLLVANTPAGALTDVCRFALSIERQFPDFMCEQITERYEPRPMDRYRSIVQRAGVITATVRYVDGTESYSDVKLNGKPTTEDPLNINGLSSHGEFATALRNIFDPESKTQFTFVGEITLNSQPALVFDFQVGAANSHWVIYSGGHSVTPAYHGQLWISKAASRIMRVTQEPVLGKSFTYLTSLSVDYAEIKLGDRGPFTLPKQTKIISCTGPKPESCWRNETRFENYRKFSAETRILPAE